MLAGVERIDSAVTSYQIENVENEIVDHQQKRSVDYLASQLENFK